MQNCDLGKLRCAAFSVLERIARNPYKSFLAMFFAFGGIAVCLFFQFKAADLAAESDFSAAGKPMFDQHRAQVWRQVFDAVEARRRDYETAATSTCAEIFAPLPEIKSETSEIGDSGFDY